ncbi:hypothetical protein [Streptomyces sp. NPDC094032]|uniref:hypothetical protein n=1 Tax=Streptomyces sp. NPDC094032 TaxID=3155308 RepID=UPI00332C66F1
MAEKWLSRSSLAATDEARSYRHHVTAGGLRAMSDGRERPDAPGEHTPSTPHASTPARGGGVTDPTPAQDGIIVQGGRTAPDTHESARAIGPKQDDPRAIGPKQDDPRAIGPKQDDPRTLGQGIIVQGGRTGHPERDPDNKTRQRRAKKKMKTMALVIGGVMVLAVGGALLGRQLGHDPDATLPRAAATPTASPSAGHTPDPTRTAPPTQAAPPPPVTSAPPTATSTSSPSPTRPTPPPRSKPPTEPTPSSPPPVQAAAPVLSLRPTDVQEYCANGEWPNALEVRNSGGGNLNWSIGQLPPGITVNQTAGSLPAGSVQEIKLGGRAEHPPASGRFTLSFASSGGSGQVTVNCA